MIEKNITGNDTVVTRVRRAFGWVVFFRDFAQYSEQEIITPQIIEEAVTLFTKGRAELWVNDVQETDRLPGLFSLEKEPRTDNSVKTWKFVYTEPTTRVCIAQEYNRNKLPNVTKIELADGETIEFSPGFRGLVCLGSIVFPSRTFLEEQSFTVVSTPKTAQAQGRTFILDFTNA